MAGRRSSDTFSQDEKDPLIVVKPFHALSALTVEPVGFPCTWLRADKALAQQSGFAPEILAAALYEGCSTQAIRKYLQGGDKTIVQESLKNDQVKKRLIITYAIHRNDAECLKTLFEYGMDAEAKDFDGIPILAYAIMRPYWFSCNTLEVVRTLLIYGAKPRSIPRDMWIDYVKTPELSPLASKLRGGNKWCHGKAREVLAQTMNLSIRYSIWRAYQIEAQRRRSRQIAEAKNIVALFRIPHLIIGQEPAVKLVFDTVFPHLAMDGQEKPLVLAFAGLSGHGKTELAKQMGKVLSANLVDIDCTQLTTVFSLLGMTAGYQSEEVGSPLNNFLIRNSNKRSVVFLDEFDKTKKEVREALLKVMDSGMYTGRPSNEEVNCTKTIWILATNKGDTEIADFYAKHIEKLPNEGIKDVDITPLQSNLRKLFTSLYSPAVTGRIDEIIPFIPFRPDEQAVMAHKFLLTLADQIRKPVDLNESVLRFMGHCDLKINDDGRVCQHLAKEGYVQALGARSLDTKVGKVRNAYVREYCRTDELVMEDVNAGPLRKYVVQLNPVTEDVEEVSVFAETRVADA